MPLLARAMIREGGKLSKWKVSWKISGASFPVKFRTDPGLPARIIPLTALENGHYDAGEDAAFNPVNVAVPNTYSENDEGKVVFNRSLVNQTQRIVTENGEYDTTLNNIVIVNTPEVQPVYVSSTGLLYTPIMVMDLSNADKSAPGTGLSISAMLDRYGAMPYLEDLTITGIIRWFSAAGSIGNEKIFSSDLYPLLKKLTITPTEIRKDRGAVIDPTPDVFKLGHYAFSETNLTHLTIGSLGGLAHQGGDGYFRKDMPCPPGIKLNDIGSLDGLHLTVYAKEYLPGGGFLLNSNAAMAPNTVYHCLNYLTGEELFP